MHLLRLFFLSVWMCGSLHAESFWTAHTHLDVAGLSGIAVSPEGNDVIYTVTKLVESEDELSYQTQLYRGIPGEPSSSHPFTSGPGASFAPQWSPDGKWIAFLSTRSGNKEIHLIRPDGGEASQLTELKTDIVGFRWSPDSTQIAFVAPEPVSKEEEEAKKKKGDAYRFGEQYRPDKLWLVTVDHTAQESIPLTDGSFHVRTRGDFGTVNEEIDWSPDGKTIAFAYTTNSSKEALWKISNLASIDLESKEITQLVKVSDHDSTPRYSPDGHWIAFLRGDSPSNYLTNRQICLYSTQNKTVRELPSTFNDGPFLVGPDLIGWTRDGRHVLFYEPERTRFELVAVPLDGTDPVTVPIDSQRLIRAIAQSPSRDYVAYVGETMHDAPEVYVNYATGRGESQQVSEHNKELAKRPIPKSELVSWTSEDGTEIDGILTYPLEYSGGQVPMILVIHGGPMGVFTEGYVGRAYPYPIAAFAEAGYAVLRCNPRGSTGYGRAFREGNLGDWGGKDFVDLMRGVDAMIERGVADPERLGVCGWSYGGYMTAWTITQTDRFKAASVGAGIANLESMAGTTDIETFNGDYLLAHPWENPDLYRERSPITHVTKVDTPTLIQHPENDVRVPIGQGMELYQALNKLGKEVELVLYPRMGHHVVEPALTIDEMQRNLDWFRKHLKV